MQNYPYIKISDENGDIVNKITKENPYMTQGLNRSQRRKLRKQFRKNR